MKTEKSLNNRWKRLWDWMTFSLFLTSMLVVAQAVAKTLERESFPEVHWLTGSESMSRYFLVRAILVLGVSTICSAIASASGVDGPYTRLLNSKNSAGRKTP